MDTKMQAVEILEQLRGMTNETNRAGMARYGINVENAFGISIYVLRPMAKAIGRNHELAQHLWATGNHEARLLACFVDDPKLVTEAQMEAWALDFDSWDLCDQATTSLFDLNPLAWKKVVEWAARPEEWVRRAAFSTMAGLAHHDKRAADAQFLALLPLIQDAAYDPRNFVKKAVNWALRDIGKRNLTLHPHAVACAQQILDAANQRAGGPKGGDAEARAARWVATDALKELTSQKVLDRLAGRR